MIICARPRTVAAPPISFFISPMLPPGLRFSPPVSKQTPFPTKVSVGPAIAPAHVNQARRAGRRTTHRVDHREVLFDQRLTRDHGNPAPCSCASLWQAFSRSSGPMSDAGVLMRSRVSASPAAITSSRAASTPLWCDQFRLGRFLLLVPIERIPGEEPAERLFLGAIRWQSFQPVIPFRQGRRRGGQVKTPA